MLQTVGLVSLLPGRFAIEIQARKLRKFVTAARVVVRLAKSAFFPGGNRMMGRVDSAGWTATLVTRVWHARMKTQEGHY